MTPATTTRSLRDCLHCEHRSLRMFCNLDEAALADFNALGVNSRIESGVRLFEEETPISGVFVLCTGKVKLSSTSRQGKTLILKIAVPGDVLGLGAVLSGSRYEVTADTIEPTEVKRISSEDFSAFIHKHGEASLHAAQALSEEYRAAFFDARRLALSVSAGARLASVLLDWAKAGNHNAGNHHAACATPNMRFTMALSHEELGNLIGTSRETVTRLLSRFKREKLIEMRGATILILSPAKLENMAA